MLDYRQKTRLDTIPTKFKNVTRKSFEGTASPRQVIKAGCLDCVCWDGEDGAVKEIRICETTTCPLHKYRPYQKKN